MSAPRYDREPAYNDRRISGTQYPENKNGRIRGIFQILQISKELKQYHHVEKLEDVRVIRDRQTKASRGFGFIRFPTVEDSKAFVERNYPMIYLYGNGSSENDDQAAKVRIAYSRERDERSRGEKADGEWTCKICTFVNFPGRTKCHRCQTPQIDMATFNQAAAAKPQYMNSGDSDASPNGTPSQFLLIRNLEPTVTEDLLAKGVAKLYKPGRRSSPPTATVPKKNNAKVASTTGDANLGAKEGSLRRILLVRDRRNNESWRYGFAEFATIEDAQAALTRYNSFEKFTISSKPVTADYIHAGVFVPVFNASEETQRFTFSPLGNTATKLAYWDEDAWASELVVTASSSKMGSATGEGQARSAADQAAAAAENEGLLKPGKEADARVKKRKAEANAAAKQKKTAPAHLQFWSNRHAELHGVKPDISTENGHESKESEVKEEFKEADALPQTFANLAKKCCYLCSRQFKTEAEVNQHERVSDLHQNNLKNADLVAKAQSKMAKAGIPSTAVSEDGSEYRDRAKERRAAFGAGKKISLPLKKAATQPEEETKDEPTPAPSKGASLLGKMGWSAGEGLGAQGTGMTAPIATDMYVQGVGLGAQGGKIGDASEEAERNTKGGYGDFLERTKDKAKERFERMA
ncbi:MAG: hypothetical protein ASARMPRED_003374 [Alectoria sarmentosa]|nr:MAG: hypothetical protein ASARMPRED_003374 [Alectoria sarmentosa]